MPCPVTRDERVVQVGGIYPADTINDRQILGFIQLINDRQIRIDTLDLATPKLYFGFQILFIHHDEPVLQILMNDMYNVQYIMYCTSTYFPIGTHDMYLVLIFQLNSSRAQNCDNRPIVFLGPAISPDMS